MYTFNAITTNSPIVPLKWLNQLVLNSVCLCTCVYVHIQTHVCKVPKAARQPLWTRRGRASRCTRLVQETACLLWMPVLPTITLSWLRMCFCFRDRPRAVEHSQGLKPNRTPRSAARQRWGSTGKRGLPPRRAGTTAVPMKSNCEGASRLPHGRFRGFRVYLWKINHKKR